jgi:hypothetical protein
VNRDEAMAHHPSTYRPMREVWTPADFEQAVLDAQAVVQAGKHGHQPSAAGAGRHRMIGVSRYRKARIYDGLAVALLLTLMACLGVILFAASAKADPDSDAVAYAAEYGGTVCSVLDDGHNTIAGLTGIMQAIQKHGNLTAYQSGEVVGLSVAEICPQYTPLLRQFVARNSKATIA